MALTVAKWEAVRVVDSAEPTGLRAHVIDPETLGPVVAIVTLRHDGQRWFVSEVTVTGDPMHAIEQHADQEAADVAGALGRLRAIDLIRAVVTQVTMTDVESEVRDFIAATHVDSVHRYLTEAPEAPKPARRGRPPIADDEIREWAEATLELHAAGSPGGLHASLALRFGESDTRARDRIRQARDREYLAPAPPRGEHDFQPGRRMLHTWMIEGLPEWHPDHATGLTEQLQAVRDRLEADVRRIEQQQKGDN